MRFLQFALSAKNSLRLTQHPIEAMLQFDANAHANLDTSVNGPLD